MLEQLGDRAAALELDQFEAGLDFPVRVEVSQQRLETWSLAPPGLSRRFLLIDPRSSAGGDS